MSEWSSYSLHDLLIFSPESYFRLFARSNQDFWPFQLTIIAVALLMLYLTTVRTVRAQLFILVGLALFWLLSGWWFVHQFYSQINTIADWYLWLFLLQIVLLLLYATLNHLKTGFYRPAGDAMLGLGMGIAVYALFIHPLLLLLAGREWRAVELVGVAPDPTAIATIGFVLAMGKGKLRFWLLIIPAIWIMISVLTYSTFG